MGFLGGTCTKRDLEGLGVATRGFGAEFGTSLLPFGSELSEIPGSQAPAGFFLNPKDIATPLVHFWGFCRLESILSSMG